MREEVSLLIELDTTTIQELGAKQDLLELGYGRADFAILLLPLVFWLTVGPVQALSLLSLLASLSLCVVRSVVETLRLRPTFLTSERVGVLVLCYGGWWSIGDVLKSITHLSHVIMILETHDHDGAGEDLEVEDYVSECR